MAKVALLIGVEDYRPEAKSLPGAANNIAAMKQVLQHPEVGRFSQVTALHNPDPLVMQQTIEMLFSERQREDLVLLYFYGQGIKNNQGKLYLAMASSRQDAAGKLVRSTAVPATFIQDTMNSSAAQQQVVILDCWFREAALEDWSAPDDPVVNHRQQVSGQRQAVLLASTTETHAPQQSSDLSAFTLYLVKGLATGAADLDNDGVIAIDEWHEYARRNLQVMAPATQLAIYAAKAGNKILLAQAPIDDPKQRYRQTVERWLRREESAITRGILEVVRDRLGLMPQEAVAIEAQALQGQATPPSTQRGVLSPLQSRTKAPVPQTPRTPPSVSTQPAAFPEPLTPPQSSVEPSPTAKRQAVKVALLIGVSDCGAGFTPLPGAIKDIEALQHVLQHPQREFAQVKTLINPGLLVMQQTIETLFGDCQSDDLVVLYFSGHGVKDDRGKLYLTTSATRKDTQGRLIKSTAVPASFLQDVMGDSQSRRQVLILDCWFGGTFTENWLAENVGPVNIQNQFGGAGRVILASSTATQSAFEQKGADLSTYTDYLVEGLETGAADLNSDGAITVQELHEYTRRKVQKSAPATQPEIYGAEVDYGILLAKAPIDDARLEYRKEVERCASYGGISVVSRSILDLLREKLGLPLAETTAIERQVLKPHQAYQKKLQRYAQVLVEAIQQEYPLHNDTRSRFIRFQQVLGLRNEDISLIEAQVVRQVRGDQSAAQFTSSLDPDGQPSKQATPARSLANKTTPVKPAEKSTARRHSHPVDNTTDSSNQTQKNRWLLLGAATAALLALVGIIYGFRHWQSLQRLKTAQALATQKNYEDCFQQAQAIPVSSAAQNLLQYCGAEANWQNVQAQSFADGYGDTVWALAISPRSSMLASTSDDTVNLWEIATGKLLRTLSGHTDIVWAIAISSDGQTLASGSSDQTINIWNFKTGKLLHTLSGHTSRVLSVAISPDGQTLASGSNDKTIKLWNLSTGELLRTLKGHTKHINAIAISPNGKTIASGSEDQTVKLWNLDTGEVRRTLSAGQNDVYAVAFSPDGQSLASGNKDGIVKIWRRS